jgi:Type ISP C-terminal specificity domain
MPLYLYPSETDLDQTRRVNMDPKIRRAIEDAAMGKAPTALAPTSPSKGEDARLRAGGGSLAGPKDSPTVAARHLPPNGEIKEVRPDEVAIFDYIYGVLHCPAYRETYREFLKIDFPRVPYPPSPEVFWDVSAKGTSLRKLHLMEPEAIGETPYPFTGEAIQWLAKLSMRRGAWALTRHRVLRMCRLWLGTFISAAISPRKNG